MNETKSVTSVAEKRNQQVSFVRDPLSYYLARIWGKGEGEGERDRERESERGGGGGGGGSGREGKGEWSGGEGECGKKERGKESYSSSFFGLIFFIHSCIVYANVTDYVT